MPRPWHLVRVRDRVRVRVRVRGRVRVRVRVKVRDAHGTELLLVCFGLVRIVRSDEKGRAWQRGGAWEMRRRCVGGSWEVRM
tara:strand:+ start:200 stop:445 length:246 start_codon:yes stop_codon:yes gene_type:complete